MKIFSVEGIIIISLLAISIILGQCNKGSGSSGGRDTLEFHHRDSSFIFFDSTIQYKPEKVGSFQQPVPEQYIPDSDYDTLLRQYMQMRSFFLAHNVYDTTLQVGDSSWVRIKDTVNQNEIASRGFQYHLGIPIITDKTVIVTPQQKRRMLLLGGGAEVSNVYVLNSVSLGMRYRDRKDNEFGISYRKEFKGPFAVQFERYWPIRLRKQ